MSVLYTENSKSQVRKLKENRKIVYVPGGDWFCNRLLQAVAHSPLCFSEEWNCASLFLLPLSLPSVQLQGIKLLSYSPHIKKHLWHNCCPQVIYNLYKTSKFLWFWQLNVYINFSSIDLEDKINTSQKKTGRKLIDIGLGNDI